MSLEITKDYDIADSELNLISCFCKWHGSKISQGLYCINHKLAGAEFMYLLEKHSIPWVRKTRGIFVTIDFSVKQAPKHININT